MNRKEEPELEKTFFDELNEAIDSKESKVIDASDFQPKIEILSVEKFAYYELRTERVTWPDGTFYESQTAYNHEGAYIGGRDFAEILMELDIKPERAPRPETRKYDSNTPCSIGFSEKEQKWYGWSHRAIYGFGIGDVAKKGDCVCSSGRTKECLEEHPDWDMRIEPGTRVETLEDARRFAIAFADSVS